MRYVFVSPLFLIEVYFCSWNGAGFKVSNRMEDALTATDYESARKEAERLKRQSGFPVLPKRVVMLDRCLWGAEDPAFAGNRKRG
jgi:hypothetical protein